MKHYRYGGSTAGRTLQCPAWARMSDGIPRAPAGEAALRGTAIHYILEQKALTDGQYQPEEGDECPDTGLLLDAEMSQTAAEMWDAWAHYAEIEGITDYEPEVSVHYSSKIGGTADLVAWNKDTREAYVVDWKTGFVPVPAHENPSLLFYAAFASYDSCVDAFFHDVKRIRLVIIQPNMEGEVEVKEYATTPEAVYEFREKFTRLVENAESVQIGDLNGLLKPGDHCKYCPAAPTCPAHMEAARYALAKPDMGLVEAKGLVEQLKLWIREVDRAVKTKLEAGGSVPGWKLVRSRATRRWKDEEAAEQYLRKVFRRVGDITKRELVSPAQAEKLAKSKGKDIDLEDLVSTESTSTTVVPEDDKRPRVLPSEAVRSALRKL